VEQALRNLSRPVRLLATGGTIAMRDAMRGERAVPALDAAALIDQVPQLASVPALEAETLLALPGPQLTLEQALMVCSRAAAAARDGEGVVVTTGTDTLEELAMLCALLHGSPTPIVLTGANRPGSNPGADGPANLIDAVVVAGARASGQLGTVVVFGGEIHAATSVRKVDSTGPAAFGSPSAGPVGRVVEGRIWIHSHHVRPQALQVERLGHRVEIVTSTLGDDGTALARAALDADGLVVVAFGAGHLSPGALDPLRDAVTRVPVVVTCRPERSSMLFGTYGFVGAEQDVRAAGAICAPFLSPAAARIGLLCCLGAGLDAPAMRATFAPWDAGL
jgi:L-asparaginase